MTGTPHSVFTIGHSTRSIDEFIALLEASRIERLVDVRSFPGSRRLPHFNSEALAESLAAASIDYTWMKDLGGRRKRSLPREDTRNAMWENQSFRNYADYALSAAFNTALGELEALAAAQRCAIMCSEAVWWRCHRRIVTDHLLARGHAVEHILGPGQIKPATLTPGAQVAAGGVIYPAAQMTLDMDDENSASRISRLS